MNHKITIAAAFALSLTVAASAQSMYDGLNYTDVNNYGTARSMALGNAMTAVGGDLGSISLNPAGSAVFKYSVFSMSMGYSKGETSSSYSPIAGTDNFTGSYNDSKTKMTMPNIGHVMYVPSGVPGALRSISWGLLVNTANRSLDRMTSMGTNSNTSMMGAMAYNANGIKYSDLSSSNAYSNYAWPIPLSYNAWLIGDYGGYEDQYLGTTEKEFEDGSIGLAGPVDQKFIMQHTGSRNDLTLNAAANFCDNVFIGVNVNFPMMSYNEDIYMREDAVDPSDFEMTVNGGAVTRFLNGYQRYYLNAEGSGINAQFGAIVLPFAGLRLGASIKTSTLYSITERWGYDAGTTFTKSPVNGGQPYAASPDGEYTYMLKSPGEYNLGIAYTLGSSLLLSMDVSGINYGKMKFRSSENTFASDEFDGVNADIRDFAGKTKIKRFGVEWKLTSAFALRYGHEEKEYKTPTDGGKSVTKSNTLGIGYSGGGSFFADLAARVCKYPDQWYYPYADYMYDGDDLILRSAEVGYSKKMLDVVLTLGWRF